MPLRDGHGPGRIPAAAKVTSPSQNARSHRREQPPIVRQMRRPHRRIAAHQRPLWHTPQVLTGSRVRPRVGVLVVVLLHHCCPKPIGLEPADTTRTGCRLGRKDWIRSSTRPYGATLAQVMQAAQAAPLKSACGYGANLIRTSLRASTSMELANPVPDRQNLRRNTPCTSIHCPGSNSAKRAIIGDRIA